MRHNKAAQKETDMKSLIHITDIVYMLLLIGGGGMGYAKAKSMPSLIAGVVTGLVALAASLLYDHHPRASLALGTLLAIAVTGIFLSRYRKTGAKMPAIPMIGASIIVAIVQIAVFAMKH